MSRHPAITLAIRAAGFVAAARAHGEATTAAAEILALRMALATIDGAAIVLRTHARVLRNTGAAHERGRLRSLDEMIVVRLGDLLRRVVAQELQGITT